MYNQEIKLEEEKFQNFSSGQIAGGYIFKDSFKHWKPLLEKWIESINKYCLKTGNAPYLDNEMGNVGMLMAAVWQVEGIAVCEKLVKRTNGKNGRLDLWMKLADNGIEELIEAKHTYHLAKQKNDGKPDKYDYMELKRQVIDCCAERLDIKDNQRAAAMVFLTYNFDQNREKMTDIEKKIINATEKEEKIKLLLNASQVKNDWDVVAWCFPLEMREEKHPGVILSAKCIKKYER